MRRGFGFHDRHSPFRFDPATLFIGGAIEGAFYDTSNISTLFQDDAGTTPVTAVEQTVGCILDLSGNANHATQSVLASRPTYRARYNLALQSEALTNAAWTAINSSIAASTTGGLPPNTAAAFKITEDSSASTTHYFLLTNDITVASGGRYRTQIRAKAAERTWFALQEGQGVTATAYFNLATGAVGTVSGTGSPTASIQSLGDSWFLCTLNWSALGTAARIRAFLATGDGGAVYTGNGTSGLYMTGADLRANADSSFPYQKITTATSYDTAGFLPYLAFDGSNDSMLTGSIDFTGTDKMTVWAGVTKNSDAAQGVVAELSATIASNNGAFLLSAPNSAAANYNWSSKGTTQVDNTVTTYAAPNTAVLTGQANIAGPSNIIRVNGAQAGSVATTQGTGNFGNYPLYIGRRNNATLPFNGRLYGLIVLGAAASDWQVYVTEQWMAGKTGLQF